MTARTAAPPWSFRRLEPSDVAAYRALRLAALRESPTAYGSSAEEEEALPMAVFEDRLAPAADRAVFGVFDGTTLVGVAGIVREPKAKRAHTATVFGVYVAPPVRGRGVGRGLMRFAIDQAETLPGRRQLRLCVNADNTAALNLYTSLGFVIFGREIDALVVDGHFHDELHMALRWQPADGAA
jgi:ribosomal protein S18 acetylase RimI-like enzyme